MPPQRATGGSRQLGTPRVRPSHWAPRHRLGELKRAASKVADFTAFDHPRYVVNVLYLIGITAAFGACYYKHTDAPQGGSML